MGAIYMINVQEIDNTRPILDTLKNLKLHFKMLQNFSLIVCIKKATKCVMIFPSQNDLNGALNVGVCQIYVLLNCLRIT